MAVTGGRWSAQVLRFIYYNDRLNRILARWRTEERRKLPGPAGNLQGGTAHMGIDPRGPRFSALITTVVLAVVLITGSVWLLAAQALVFAAGSVFGSGAAQHLVVRAWRPPARGRRVGRRSAQGRLVRCVSVRSARRAPAGRRRGERWCPGARGRCRRRATGSRSRRRGW